ncbi:uncharacterized protein LOC106167394 isoform X2 [Lingula anatina]|uniref:Uncharacterized protein LOC106167394 isoform X2 n=1 Tax=Lingula anatina TaxID=7574 RepID=A0A1S3IU87_LINAN|nr:uncharacterized protein LOC106167394 isoform X2 [Lingula anatina]|eukprot:XP_013401638.1 uncharacterized protein LOC106167394 isoform X2 [Lingula anatina]
MAHTPTGQQIDRLQEILDSLLESPNAQVPVNLELEVTSKKLLLLFAITLVAYLGELVHSCVFMRADSSMIFFFYPAMLAFSWESAEVWRSQVCSDQSLMQVITSFWRRLADLHEKEISPGPVECV